MAPQEQQTGPGTADAPPQPPEASGAGNQDAGKQDAVDVHSPQFAAFDESSKGSAVLPLDRFYDVNIKVWAELGRIEMPIGELMKMGDGRVVKFNRPVSHPVDLVAQGVRFARGEVVVVDDCFAVRITEVEDPQRVGARTHAAAQADGNH